MGVRGQGHKPNFLFFFFKKKEGIGAQAFVLDHALGALVALSLLLSDADSSLTTLTAHWTTRLMWLRR